MFNLFKKTSPIQEPEKPIVEVRNPELVKRLIKKIKELNKKHKVWRDAIFDHSILYIDDIRTWWKWNFLGEIRTPWVVVHHKDLEMCNSDAMEVYSVMNDIYTIQKEKEEKDLQKKIKNYLK